MEHLYQRVEESLVYNNVIIILTVHTLNLDVFRLAVNVLIFHKP